MPAHAQPDDDRPVLTIVPDDSVPTVDDGDESGPAADPSREAFEAPLRRSGREPGPARGSVGPSEPGPTDTGSDSLEAEPPADAPRRAKAPGGVTVPPAGQRARPLPAPPPSKPVPVVTESDLRAQVDRMAEAYRVGDSKRFLVERAELENMRLRAGVRNVVLASAILIRFTEQALAAKAVDQAVDLSAAAVRLSPDLVAARWAELRVLWLKDWAQLRRIGAAGAGLLSAQFGVFRNQVTVLSASVLVVGLALLLTVLVYAATQLFKYVRYAAHDVAVHLPEFIGGPEVVVAFVVLTILPVAFGLGPAVSVLVALSIVGGYQIGRERTLSRLMMIVLALVPALLYAGAPLITFHGSLVDDMATAMSEAFAGPSEARLLAATKGQTRDSTSALILAQRKRLRGDLAGADIAYERALIARPQDAVALNNRGVVQFMLGRHEAAASLFQRGLGTERVEPILNLATLRAEEGKFDEATSLLERARRRDPELASRYTGADEGADSSQPLVEAEIDESALWPRLFEVEAQTRWQVAESLWRRLGGPTPLWLISVLALIAFGASVVMGRRRERLSVGCPKCGTPATRQAHGQLCQQCTSVFLTAVAVEPRLRAQKETEVRAYQRRRRITERVSAVLAGVGHLLSGRPLAGGTLFFIFAVALLTWAFRHGVVVHDWQIAFDGSASAFVGGTALIVAAALAVWSVRQSFER